MTREISNSEDTLDSREIIAAIEDFEQEAITAWEESNGVDPLEGYDLPADFDAAEYLDGDEADLYRALKDLAKEGEGSPDWKHGEVLIRDDYFEDYARDLAEDIGAIDREAAWPLGYIDWKAASEALLQDYTSVDFDGVTYWIRA